MPRCWMSLVFATVWLVACATPPPPAPPLEPLARFSAERAWDHLEAIVGFGARHPGSEGAEATRAYLRSHLESLGLEVHAHTFALPEGLRDSEASGDSDAGPTEITHLTAVMQGAGRGVVVLAAPYDTPEIEDMEFVGANDGASGAALLLELARALSVEPLPYTVWLSFMDGDAPPMDANPDEGGLGSQLWAEDLRNRGALSKVRVAFYFNRVADAELEIGRDLISHRISRFRVFSAARRLGHGQAFPRGLAFQHVPGGHRAFIDAGMRRAVAIGDPVHGGDDAPGSYWHTEKDSLAHCSPESLGIVGEVALEALEDLAGMWTKIDRFARQRGEAESLPSPYSDGNPEEDLAEEDLAKEDVAEPETVGVTQGDGEEEAGKPAADSAPETPPADRDEAASSPE